MGYVQSTPGIDAWCADGCCLRIQAHVLVENITPVNWDTATFDRLALPQRMKDLIKALVPRQRTESARPSANSGQEGKRSGLASTRDRGLIMHLYGPWGTGKTLTAGKYVNLCLLMPTKTDCP